MRLEIQRTIPNMIAHWIDQAEIKASSGYSLYSSRDKGITFDQVADLRVSQWAKILGKSRVLSRALRLGIRDLRILKSNATLAIADRKIFRAKDSDFQPVFSFKRGFGPLREGWCEDDKGVCYLSEYFLNNKRDGPVNLYKSVDDGQSWEIIRSFQQVRHIHCIQYDPYARRIWMGTGDRDYESRISFSENGGKSWSKIGSENQMFRAVSLVFTQDFVYWGTDASTMQNYICRYERKNGSIKKMAAVSGPVHYSMILENGIILFGTTTEGESEGKSAEWDRKAHIYASEDGIQWKDIASWEKDRYPYVLGFGRVYFPHGRLQDDIFFTTEALKKVDNTLFCANICTE